ncbi:unnamed protein product [Nesidiocoris tenuis]|uniref:Uncharacterized protein n=1 Tax=Nesidiocoris tenuis TaxID=355587 RepID=A0A6H5HYE3_9HEMI|nr:unnamed protein product [Nesidiocoris tenuis]
MAPLERTSLQEPLYGGVGPTDSESVLSGSILICADFYVPVKIRASQFYRPVNAQTTENSPLWMG